MEKLLEGGGKEEGMAWCFLASLLALFPALHVRDVGQ